MTYITLISIMLSYFSFQEGDLLFQDSDCGPFCIAIEKVTTGYNGARLSHVGMVVEEEDGTYVIEAIGKGVVLTPIDSFLLRSLDENGLPKVLVGRLHDDFKHLIPAATEHMKNKLSKFYDSVFDITNDAYYCSELIYEGFKVANKNEDVFKLFPMTFKDPDTNEMFDIWVEYFKDLSVEIPEGELGLNPGGISRSPYISIVKILGQPKGMIKD
jgi:hypothetical protein